MVGQLECYTSGMTRATLPHYSFDGNLAVTLGLDAAALYSVVQQSVQFLGRDNAQWQSVQRTDEDWLASVPFLSPGRFVAALERLEETGLLRSERVGAERVIAVPLEGDPAPGMDDDFDTPPPLPRTQLLTDGKSRVDQAEQPRYSGEPLYARYLDNGSASESQDNSAASAETSKNEGRTSGPMTLQWQPSDDCLRMCEGKGIGSEFALAQRESFVLYYRDSGQRQVSWDSKFLSWVSRRWQYHLNDRRHEIQTSENGTGTHRERRQKLRDRLRDLGDLDW